MNRGGIDGGTEDASEQLARARSFLRRALRSWRVALSIWVLGGIATGAVLLLRRPMYRSETVILYTEGVRVADDAERPDNARSVTLRLKELLMTRASLDAVAREFDLYPAVRTTLGPVDAVEELRRNVEFRAPGGDTFSIAFTGASPEQARDVTRRLGALVIGQDAELRQKQALVAQAFLKAEERTTEAGLRAREEDLATFMSAHPRFAYDATPLTTGAAIRATRRLVVAGSQPRPRGRSPGVVTSVPGIAAVAGGPSPSSGGESREATAEVARSTAAVAAARANLAELAVRFTAAHPDVRAAEAELERETSRRSVATTASLTAKERAVLDAESLRVRDGASPPVPAAPPTVVAARVGATAAPATSALLAPEGDVVALETDWVRLTRGVTEAREHQDQIEAALFKANLAASSESAGGATQMTVIDPAFLPRSTVPPGRTVIVGGLVAMTLLLGALAALLRAVFDDRVYDARDMTGISELLAEVARPKARRAHAGS